jgi:acetylornithine deacetylase
VSGDIARLRRFTENQVEELQRVAPESAIEWEKISNYPPFTPPDPGLVEFVSALAKAKGAPGTVSFGTEAGIFARAGIPTIVCGPGDIARAHKTDEFIRLDELAACDAFLERLTTALCNGLPV